MFELLAIAGDPNPYWQVFGRLHPLLVHFPVALILLGALVEVFWWLAGRRETSSGTGAFCLWVGLVGGMLAAWAGWTLADHQQEAGDLVDLHRWVTIAGMVVLAAAAVAWIKRRRKGREWAAAHIGLFCIAAILIAVGGHFGGDMVWGKGWVLKPLDAVADDATTSSATTPSATTPLAGEPGNATQEATDAASSVTWTQVSAILEAHCGDCHGPDRQKAGVQVVPWSALFPDDRAFWVVDPGDAAASLMHERITLPRDADGAMPPPGKGDPLTDTQIKAINQWISQGAHGPDDSVPGGDEPTQASAAPDAAPSPPAIDDVAAPVTDEAAVAAAIQAVREAQGGAMPVSRASPWIDVSFAQAGDAATDASLDAMSGLSALVVRLDLSRTAVTDAGMKTVAACTNLRVLELDHTGVGDAGVASLVQLDHLERLNLYGSKVTDGVAASLEAMKPLRVVYLGGTSVSEGTLSALRDARPDLEVHGNAKLAEPPAPAPAEEPAGEGTPPEAPSADPPTDTPADEPDDQTGGAAPE